jgi:hypothetical protein
MSAAKVVCLDDLRGHRTAPLLTGLQRQQLQEELRQRVGACEWCTIGVMAPGSGAAQAALLSFQQALGWEPFEEASVAAELPSGSVFLKGHQRTAKVWVRQEAGLGEGVLVSGHSESNPDVEDTWGPLPLDFFPCDSSERSEAGTTGP